MEQDPLHAGSIQLNNLPNHHTWLHDVVYDEEEDVYEIEYRALGVPGMDENLFNEEIAALERNSAIKRMIKKFMKSQLLIKVKGRKRGSDLSWQIMEKAIQEAVEVFGKRFVSTHLIIGLGETEKQAIQFLQKFYDLNITVGLFAFTPVKGTTLEKHPQPPIDSYRRIQLARYLINAGKTSYSKIRFGRTKEQKERILDFGVEKEELDQIITYGKPFRTSGCPHCNRPFYNESPGKDLYNYPNDLTEEEVSIVRNTLSDFVEGTKSRFEKQYI